MFGRWGSISDILVHVKFRVFVFCLFISFFFNKIDGIMQERLLRSVKCSLTGGRQRERSCVGA